jgi:dinuclear metal center YbgI/SA1388 family protein
VGVTVKQVVDVMEGIAPSYLSEKWDNTGLLIGGMQDVVRKIMVCLDVTDSVVNEAIQNGVDMLISHHPIIFEALKNLRSDDGKGRLLHLIIKNNIAVYCAHTNLDKAPGGVDDVLAARLGLENIEPLTTEEDEKLYKIAVYIPKGHEDSVMNAMAEAGAGMVRNYSHCTFQTRGIGTFLPLEGTKPYIGQQGRIERVDEVRLETIARKRDLEDIVKAMLNVHPYEEVAYDIYPLANRIGKQGLGRIGTLRHETPFGEFAKQVCRTLGIPSVLVAGRIDRKVRVVASCAGSGASLISKAYAKGAHVFVTGEMKYHDACDVESMGMAAIVAGHYATEFLIVDELIRRLQKAFDDLQYEVEVLKALTMADPYTIIGE